MAQGSNAVTRIDQIISYTPKDEKTEKLRTKILNCYGDNKSYVYEIMSRKAAPLSFVECRLISKNIGIGRKSVKFILAICGDREPDQDSPIKILRDLIETADSLHQDNPMLTVGYFVDRAKAVLGIKLKCEHVVRVYEDSSGKREADCKKCGIPMGVPGK